MGACAQGGRAEGGTERHWEVHGGRGRRHARAPRGAVQEAGAQERRADGPAARAGSHAQRAAALVAARRRPRCAHADAPRKQLRVSLANKNASPQSVALLQRSRDGMDKACTCTPAPLRTRTCKLQCAERAHADLLICQHEAAQAGPPSERLDVVDAVLAGAVRRMQEDEKPQRGCHPMAAGVHAHPLTLFLLRAMQVRCGGRAGAPFARWRRAALQGEHDLHVGRYPGSFVVVVAPEWNSLCVRSACRNQARGALHC